MGAARRVSALAPLPVLHPSETPIGLLTPKQAAAWLACSVRTLYNLPIRRVKLGRLTRYDVRDLQLFADLHGTTDRLTRAS